MRKVLCLAALAALLAVSAGATDYELPYLNGRTMSGAWTLHSAATTGNGNTIRPASIGGNSVTETVCYVAWSAGVTAGALQPESASVYSYAGTWAPEGPAISWTAASRQDVFTLSGDYRAFRMRISSNIVNGTVTVTCSAR